MATLNKMHITYTGESIGRNIGKVYGNLVQMNPL